MRSPLELLRRPRNATTTDDQAHPPVPYVSRSGNTGGGLLGRGDDRGAQLAAMAANPTAYAVVDVLANPTALVHWRLYRTAASGKEEDREEVTDHPALTLWRKPNPRMVRALFMETVNQHYELTGEGAMVLYKIGTLPVQLWPCRPDRLSPVPHPSEFLTGWIYQSPDGEKVPLPIDEVLWIRTPNPTDPYRGLGPFGALQTTMDTQRFGELYNRNFFVNGAEPGGSLESPEVLSDERFETLRKRWAEQHRGVAAAHRVAILEGGMKFVPAGATHKDMQYIELDKRTGEKVREAKRVHAHMLGITEDVNRANAEAALANHGQMQLIPRLERWKQLLNYDLLPMFGQTTGRGFEFDYDNPVPEDRDAARQDLATRVDAWVKLVTNGAEPEAAAAIAGLPDVAMAGAESGTSPRQIAEMVQKIYLGVGTVITWEEARTILVAAGATLDLTLPAPAAAGSPIPVQARATRLDALPPPVNASTAAGLPQDSGPRAEQAGKPDVDLDEVQHAWERQLGLLLAAWGSVLTVWQQDLLDQIRSAVDSGKVERLTRLSLDSEDAANLVAEHMTELAATAADRVVREAQRQGVDGLEPKIPTARVIEDQAAVTAGLLAAGLAIAAGREAMRVNAPDLDGNQVADKVAEFLRSMSDAGTRSSLGGALTGAQNQARIETFRSGPIASLYADEKLDSNTCAPCRAIDGRYIGSTEDGASMVEVEKLYPMGGYVDCLGRDRCRGTITGVWRKGVDDD